MNRRVKEWKMTGQAKLQQKERSKLNRGSSIWAFLLKDPCLLGAVASSVLAPGAARLINTAMQEVLPTMMAFVSLQEFPFTGFEKGSCPAGEGRGVRNRGWLAGNHQQGPQSSNPQGREQLQEW